MERISLVGTTWRTGGQDVLDRSTVPDAARDEALPRIARALGSNELLYLATCHRVEVAFVAEEPAAVASARRALWSALGLPPSCGDAEHHFRAWSGEGAVEHLFMVAAGLDSARVGETEIAGQVRRALDRSASLGLLGPRLKRAGEEALRLARRIHRTTRVGEGALSLASIALDHVRDRLDGRGGAVALIGVSPMTRRCAFDLAADGVPFVVVNRTFDRAASLCADVRAGAARPLDEFRERPDPVEAVVLATNAPGPVLGRAALERLAGLAPSGAPPLLVDLGVPANVAPADAAAAGLPRIGMNEIADETARTRDGRLRESADARVLVDEALAAFRRDAAERTLEPLIAALHRRYRHTADEGVERLLKRLSQLAPSDEAVLCEWARTLAARFAHIPCRGLRNLAAEWGTDPVGTFFRDVDERLLGEVREHLPPRRGPV